MQSETSCPLCKKTTKGFIRHVRMKHKEKSVEERVVEQMMLEEEKSGLKNCRKTKRNEDDNDENQGQRKKMKLCSVFDTLSSSTLEKVYLTGPKSQKELEFAFKKFEIKKGERNWRKIALAVKDKMEDLSLIPCTPDQKTSTLPFLIRGKKDTNFLEKAKQKSYEDRQRKLSSMIQFAKYVSDRQKEKKNKKDWLIASYLLCYSSFLFEEITFGIENNKVDKN